MIQALFLVSVVAAPFTLLAAIMIARMHWRLDIGPYREGYAFRILARPSSYVQPDWVGSVRALALAGGSLLATSFGSLVYQLAVALAR